jgi:hypothetical protein
MYIAGPTNTGDLGISTGSSFAPRTDCHLAM